MAWERPEQEDEIAKQNRLRYMRLNAIHGLKDVSLPVSENPLEASGPMLQLLKQYYGTAQGEPTSLRARAGNPNVEKQMKEEADALMAEENAAKSWHPPMALPNTPRDPEKERREQDAMKAFLAGGRGPSYGLKKQGGMSSIIPSQNPFSERTASPEEQAKVAGASMASQLPVNRPVQNVQPGSTPSPAFSMPEGFPSNPMDSQQDIPNQMVSLPENSYDTRQTDNSEPNPLRDRLLSLINADQSPEGMRSNRDERMRLQARMNDISNRNADLGFIKMLMRNANQAGQIGGKVASSAPFDDQIDSIMKRNSEAEQRFINSDKAMKTQKDQRLSSLLALLKMDQDAALRREGFDVQRENNAAMRDYRQDMLNATAGRDAENIRQGDRRIDISEANQRQSSAHQGAVLNEQSRHNKAMEDVANANAKNAAQRAAKNGDHLPLGYKDRITTLSNIQTKRASAINKFKESLKVLRSAKSEKEKYDYAKTLIKMLNSLEGSDAVGAEEAKRFAANLDNFRPEDILVGANPFGKNFKAFEDMIQNQIRGMEGNYRADQAEIDEINRKFPAPQGVMNPGLANPSTPSNSSPRTIDNFDDL